MVVITPGLAWTFMQEIPKFVEAMDPKGTTTAGKNAKALNAVFETIGTLTEGSKSSSIGTSTTTGGTASEADSLTDIFKNPFSSGGLANSLKIGPSTQPGIFKPLEPMYGIGAGWGIGM